MSTLCGVFGPLIDKTYVWTVLSTHLFNDQRIEEKERNRNSWRLYCTNDKDIYWKTADDRASLLSYIGQNPSFAGGHPAAAIEVLCTVDEFLHVAYRSAKGTQTTVLWKIKKLKNASPRSSFWILAL